MNTNVSDLNFWEYFTDAIRSYFSAGSTGLSLDLQSSILIVIGLAIFFFSAYKGVKHNDPYPEYAGRHLRFLEADEDLILTEQMIRDEVSDAIRTFNEEVNETINAAVSGAQPTEVTVPSVDQVQGFLDWQSDRVSRMIAEGEKKAIDKFSDEVQQNPARE